MWRGEALTRVRTSQVANPQARRAATLEQLHQPLEITIPQPEASMAVYSVGEVGQSGLMSNSECLNSSCCVSASLCASRLLLAAEVLYASIIWYFKIKLL